MHVIEKRGSPLKYVTLLIVFLFILSLAPSFESRAASVYYTGLASPEGFDYVVINSKIDFDNATITFPKGSSTGWAVENYWNNGLYVSAITRHMEHGEHHITDDPIVFVYSDAVVDAAGNYYDLRISAYDIWLNVENTWADVVVFQEFGYGTEYSANLIRKDPTEGVGIGVYMDVEYNVLYRGTNNPADGTVIYGFVDLDMPGKSAVYSTQNNYTEGISILSGNIGGAYVQSDTWLNIQNNGTTFLSTKPSEGYDEWLKTSMTFLADARSAKIRWSGRTCGTGICIDLLNYFTQYQITATSEGPGSATPASSKAFKGQNKAVIVKADTNAHIKSITVDGVAQTVTNSRNMTISFPKVRANHTVHAVFESDLYTVNYTTNSSAFNSSCPDKTITGTYATKTCLFGTQYTHPNALTNPYYYFTGWKYNNSIVAGGSSFTNLATTPGATVTEVAQWSPKLYTIKYNANKSGAIGADKTEPSISVESSGLAWDPSSTAKLTGFRIKHWNTKADLTGTNVPFGYQYQKFWYKPATNKDDVWNLYGVWSPINYYVKYNNGSSQFHTDCPNKQVIGDTSTITCVYNTSYNHHGKLTNDYYYFTGWKTNTGSPVAAGSSFKNLSTTDGASITEIAQWSPKTYTIKYNANKTGATGASKTVSNISVKDSGTFWTPESAYAAGYYVDHWNTKADDTGVTYKMGSTYKAFWYKPDTDTSSVINLYAIWKPYTYEVIYKSGEGNGSDITETWTVDQAHNLYNNTPNLASTKTSALSTPHFTKEGYYIDYWVPSFPTSVYETSSIKTVNQVTGTGYSGNKVVSKITSTTNLLIPGNNTYSHVVSNTKGFSEKVILTAHWAPIKYKVIYNNDTTIPGSHGSPYEISQEVYVSEPYDYGIDYDIPKVNLTRKNKYGDSTFLGYCFVEGCITKNPMFVVADQYSDGYSSNRLTSINSSSFAPNVGGVDGHSNSANTIEGTTWNNYFKYLNDGSIQSFKLYAVWDDCPGIEPVDVEQQKDISVAQFNSTTPGIGTLTKSKSDLEYYILHLPQNEGTIWDREDDVSYLSSSMDNYYIKNFENLGIGNNDNVSSYKLTFVISDTFGHVYEVSRKLYSGKYYDIMLHENVTEFNQ